ncbi:hypothetical protein ACKVFM_002734 [Escherichia coli]
MNDNTPSNADIVQVRLTLDVAYCLNGEAMAEMVSHLQQVCVYAIGNGMLTGNTSAEVEDYRIDVSIPTPPLSEDEIAQYIRQRIEDGSLLAEDVPTRLARYGLMKPDDFVSEMRERMDMTLVNGIHGAAS